jgi:hypothetical protein
LVAAGARAAAGGDQQRVVGRSGDTQTGVSGSNYGVRCARSP